MNKSVKKFIEGKVFAYCKFLMVSAEVRCFFIIISLIAIISCIMETGESFFLKYQKELYTLNILFAVVFTIEFVLRFLSFERGKLGKRKFVKINYILKPSTIIDIITIIPFYLYIFYPLNILFKTLRIFRILDLVRFSKFDKSLNKISRFIRQRRTAIIATLLIAAIFIVAVATLMYLAEKDVQPNGFGSVYESLWWCIVTVTAVGYGDIVPVTSLGKILGSITCFSGILFVVIPVSIFSSQIANIKNSTKKHKLERAERKFH